MSNLSVRSPIRKKLVTDEQHRPVAVQIDYADWLEIERQLGGPSADEGMPSQNRLEALEALAERARGHWQEGDGLAYQQRIRDEWTRPWDPEAQPIPERDA